jgi:hypothetical protein
MIGVIVAFCGTARDSAIGLGDVQMGMNLRMATR